MKLSQTFKLTAISTLLATTAVLSHAHSPFVAPQTYVVDGETAAVLGGYAEAAFASEYAISGFDLTVTAPNGEVQKLETQATKHLTIADVLTKEEGTYKVVGQKESKNEYAQINGKWYRIMESHSEQVPPLAERTFATPAEVPAKAKKSTTTSHTQLVSYFSKGKVSDQVLAATGKGLEIAYSVHPSNLKAGQPVTLTVNANGKPQKNFELFALKQVLVVGEEAVEIEQKTDAKGQITLTFPKVGQYLLEVSSPATADGAAPAAESYRQHVAVLVN